LVCISQPPKEITLPWIKREDHATALLIDRALRMVALDGEALAWNYLSNYGLSSSATARILSGRHRPLMMRETPAQGVSELPQFFAI
jgi:hypothetical protein